MVVYITGNEAKAKYMSEFFELPLERKKLDLQEIQSFDLREIVTDKVHRAYEMVRGPVIVEDISLSFPALGGLPGPFIKWFLDTVGNDGMCKMLDTYQDRTAIGAVAYAYKDDSGTMIFYHEVEGSVPSEPRGEQGFGWDPIFIPNGHEETWAEMTQEKKHQTSMRQKPLEALKQHIQQKLDTI